MRAQSPWAAASAAVLLVLLIAIPLAIDWSTFDVFNLTKATILVAGALVLLGLAIVDALSHGRVPLWANGMQWPVVALLAWTAVTTLAAPNVRAAVVGQYKSYDGLVTTAAFTVVFFAVVSTFRARDVHAILALFYFGGGGLVLAYGLVQLHDLRVAGSRWDWVDWGPATFRSDSIWSTFGNPAHLGGFLAILLPVGAALSLVYGRLWVRLLIALVAAIAVVELVQTTTRGAWLAAIASLVAFGAMIVPELRRTPVRVAAVTAGSVAVAAAAVAALHSKLGIPGPGWFVDVSTGSSASQRFQLWHSALDMALDRPIFGFGPDSFAAVFPAYQTARFVAVFGPDQTANGAHDIFVNYFATEGFPGMVAFGAVVFFAALRAAGAWRRLRTFERRGDVATPGQRIVLAGVAAALIAYVVQALLDVQQIALSFCFWFLLGLLTVVALNAGVPDTLSPTRLVGLETAPVRVARRLKLRVPPAIVAVAVVVAVGAAVWQSTRPFVADHDFLAGVRARRAASRATTRADWRMQLARASAELDSAVEANPWEPEYLTIAAEVRADRAIASPNEARRFLHESTRLYRRAVGLEPRDAGAQEAYSHSLLRLTKLEPPAVRDHLAAVEALRAAVAANPWQPRYALELSSLLVRNGRPQDALATLRRALTYSPGDEQLLRAATALARPPGPAPR